MSAPPSPGQADVVGDGVLVALGAARHAVKNLLIVRALRDDLDFDREACLELASVALVRLADEHKSGAHDIAEQQPGAAMDRVRLRRRRTVGLEIAERLRRLATDDATLGTLLDDARDLALSEIAAAAGAALAPRPAGLSTGERAVALAELRDELDDLRHERGGY